MSAQPIEIQELQVRWAQVSQFLHRLESEADYARALALCDSLLDEIRDDESHPLMSLLDVVSLLITDYEAREVPELSA